MPDPQPSVQFASSWVAYAPPQPRMRLRLFCFPYAGGGASFFQSWAPHLPPEVAVCPVQLPGREARLLEPPYRRIDSLVQTLAEVLSPYLSDPFAFFGHSMGALISFELARYLRRQRGPRPAQLFLSGHRAAQIANADAPTYALPGPALVDELRRLGGTPPEVLANDDLMRLMLPLLRADLEMCETYRYDHEPPLACPVTAFGGLEDPKASRDELRAWQAQTRGAFALRMLPGGHFFVHTARALLLSALAQDLSHLLWRLEREAKDGMQPAEARDRAAVKGFS